MDEMKIKISTKIMKDLITKILKKIIWKKLGYKVDIQLNDLVIKVNNGKAHLHTDVDLEMNNDELINLIKSIS